jgi:1-phosphofructokinase family hexose kinase
VAEDALLPTVHVVGANPALDRLQVVPSLTVGEVNRATEAVARPGGKGMIVARGVARLGGSVALHGFLGGPVGQDIARGCEALGIADHHVRISGDTRTTTVIIDASSGSSTVVDQLVVGVLDAVRAGDLVVCTGSLPPGVGPDLYASLVQPLRDRGVQVLIDTSGPPLDAAMRSSPDVLKVNEEELRGVARTALCEDGDADLETLMGRALELGVRSIIVTRGAAGLSCRSATHRVDVTAPEVHVVNATGSGDLMLAGFVTSLAAGEDLVTALRHGTAAGAANAARLEPDLSGEAEVLRLRELATASDVRRGDR